jgi:anaerobic ribonucleoside-triphosphate reductase activating protein
MRYASIRELDISNGEGVGVALFVQGCHFHCKNCFNSKAWDFNDGKEWTEEVKNNFLKLIDKPYIKRVSILGGEPLAKENYLEVRYLLKELKQKYPDKKIWLYTGYTFDVFENYRELLRTIIYCDVLVDGQFEEDKKDFTLKFRGSSNQRVIDVQESLKQNKVVLYCS